MGNKGPESLPTDAQSLCGGLVASLLGCKQRLFRTRCIKQGLEEMVILLTLERPTGITSASESEDPRRRMLTAYEKGFGRNVSNLGIMLMVKQARGA